MSRDGTGRPGKGSGRYRWWGLAAAALALAAVIWMPPLLSARRGPARAVRAYLAAMRDQDYRRALAEADEDCGMGMDPRPATGTAGRAAGPQGAAILDGAGGGDGEVGGGGAGSNGAAGRAAADRLQAARDLLSAQRAMVAAEFGPLAWDRPTFRLERIPSLGQALAWYTPDGHRLSASEAGRRLDAFWAGVAREHGVDLSLALSPPPRGLTPQEAEARRARMQEVSRVIQDHHGDSPVRLKAAETHATYLARLDFGRPSGASGCHDLTLTVANRSGAWRVSALQWCDRDGPRGPDI